MTNEQERVQARLLQLGVSILLARTLASIDHSQIEFACIYTDRRSALPCASLVPVTSRSPDDRLYQTLTAHPDALREAGIQPVRRIGDS